MLEHEGVFTMHVPDGWKATRSEGTYELLPPNGEGAIHISVYDRRRAPLSEVESHDVVASFVRNIGPEESVEIRVLAESKEQHRVVARCSSTDPDSGVAFDWLVFAILWPRIMLMCSATAPRGSELTSDAEMMLAAISPAERRRRLFRR